MSGNSDTNGSQHNGTISGRERRGLPESVDISVQDVIVDVSRVLKRNFWHVFWLGIKALFYLWLAFLILGFYFMILKDTTGMRVTYVIYGLFAAWNLIVVFANYARTALPLLGSDLGKAGGFTRWGGQSLLLAGLLFLFFVGTLQGLFPYWKDLVDPVVTAYRGSSYFGPTLEDTFRVVTDSLLLNVPFILPVYVFFQFFGYALITIYRRKGTIVGSFRRSIAIGIQYLKTGACLFGIVVLILVGWYCVAGFYLWFVIRVSVLPFLLTVGGAILLWGWLFMLSALMFGRSILPLLPDDMLN